MYSARLSQTDAIFFRMAKSCARESAILTKHFHAVIEKKLLVKERKLLVYRLAREDPTLQLTLDNMTTERQYTISLVYGFRFTSA